MKKFFGKLPVMITFIALAVIMTVAYIGLLVRPVAIGFTYKGKADVMGSFAPGSFKEQNVEMTFKSDNVVRTDMEYEKDTLVVDMWYYRDGNYIMPLGFKEVIEANDATKEMLKYMVMSEEDYNELIKTIEKAKEEDKKVYEQELKEEGFEINAFVLDAYDTEFKCTGSVVFAIVGGIVELVLLAGAGLAIFYKVKK